MKRVEGISPPKNDGNNYFQPQIYEAVFVELGGVLKETAIKIATSNSNPPPPRKINRQGWY